MKNLSEFFYPNSVCVPGASSKEKSIGYEVLKTIRQFGFKGDVYPVNPKSDEILGYKCYKSVSEIDKAIDLAVVLVPKPFVKGTIEELLGKGVKAVILITAGFGETGEEGEKLEEEITQMVQEAGAGMTGPNCMGVISSFDHVKLNATFVAEHPIPSSIAFLSQSGALGAAVLNSLRTSNITFGHFISVGNKADLNENDFISFWMNDDNIEVVTLYLESFEDGAGLIKMAAENKLNKPVIILKAGRTESGMKAAQSHTGALGSSDKTADAVLEQFGLIRADDLNELFNTAKGFDNFALPGGRNVAVLTNAGGPAILAVDALEMKGLKLAGLNPETEEKLREIVHPEGSVQNPVDLLPGGDAEAYGKCTEILLADNNVDALVSIFVEPVMVSPDEVVQKVYSVESRKPVFKVVMPLPEFWKRYDETELKPVFRNPEDPAAVIANMLFYKESRTEKSCLNAESKKNELSEKEGFIKTADAIKLAAAYGIPVPEWNIFKSDEKGAAVKTPGFPMVLKAEAEGLVHKSEFNAVEVNIKSEEELDKAVSRMKADLKKEGYENIKFLAQQYIEIRNELLIGGFRDPAFGPVIMFGSGGKYVEVIADTAVKSAVISDEDIEEIISSTNIGKILAGVRGEIGADIASLKKLIKASAQIMLDYPEIKEFDINPLIHTRNNEFYAVDIRIKI